MRRWGLRRWPAGACSGGPAGATVHPGALRPPCSLLPAPAPVQPEPPGLPAGAFLFSASLPSPRPSPSPPFSPVPPSLALSFLPRLHLPAGLPTCSPAVGRAGGGGGGQEAPSRLSAPRPTQTSSSFSPNQFTLLPRLLKSHFPRTKRSACPGLIHSGRALPPPATAPAPRHRPYGFVMPVISGVWEVPLCPTT